MSISREDFENQQKQKQIEIQTLRPQEVQKEATSFLETPQQTQQQIQGKVLTAKNLSTFNIKDVKQQNAMKFSSSARVDYQSSERQSRKLAAEKTYDTAKTYGQLRELMNNCKSFEDSVKLNDTIREIEKRLDSEGDSLGEEEKRKLSILKDKASGVYDRYLRLEHVNKNVNARRDRHPELAEVSQQEFERAQSEWEHTRALAEPSAEN